MRDFAYGMALLFSLASIGGCAWMPGVPSSCRYVLNWSKRLSVGFSTAPLPTEREDSITRSSVVLVLSEPPGIELWHFTANRRKVYCAEISRAQADSWVLNTERLLDEPARIEVANAGGPKIGEVVNAAFRGRRAAVPGADLSPQGRRAAQELSCLAIVALGERATEAIHSVVPNLADRISIPAACQNQPGER